MLKDVSNNISKDIHNTIFAFIDSFVQTNLIKASINRIKSILSRSQALKSNGLLSI